MRCSDRGRAAPVVACFCIAHATEIGVPATLFCLLHRACFIHRSLRQIHLLLAGSHDAHGRHVMHDSVNQPCRRCPAKTRRHVRHDSEIHSYTIAHYRGVQNGYSEARWKLVLEGYVQLEHHPSARVKVSRAELYLHCRRLHKRPPSIRPYMVLWHH